MNSDRDQEQPRQTSIPFPHPNNTNENDFLESLEVNKLTEDLDSELEDTDDNPPEHVFSDEDNS